MTLEILPQKLFTMPNVTPLMQHGNAAIFHKTLRHDLLDKEIYLSQTAILFIVKGRQLLHQNANQPTAVQQGDLLLLPKDIYLVSDYTTNDNQFEAILFFITDEITDMLRPSNLPSNPSNTGLAQIHTPPLQIAKFMASLLDIYGNQPNIGQLLELKLKEFLSLIAQTNAGREFSSAFYHSTHGRKRDIAQFMKDNYLKNLKVEDYASLTGHSKSTFTREFKKLYATTPHQWLIEQRLLKAHQILITGKTSVIQTALAVGYDNASHFTTAYKNKYNQTPNQTKSQL